MTKHLIYAIMLLGMMLTATGCSDEAFETPGTEQSAKGEKVTITVCLPENDADNQNHSRVAFDSENLKLTWQEDDRIKILALNADNSVKIELNFFLTSGAGTTKAQFSGEWYGNIADHYQIFYSANKRESGTEITYQGQAQTGNNNTDHLKDYLLLSSGEEPLKEEDIFNGNFVLTPQNSVFRFNIKSYPENVGKLKHIIWNSNFGTEKQGYNCLSINPGTDASGKQNIVAYMAFDPVQMKLDAGQYIALTLIGDKGAAMVRGVSANGLEYQPGKRYTATVSEPTVSTKSTELSESAGSTNSELNDWVNIPNPKNNQVLVITADGSSSFTDFSQQKRIEGTNCTLLSDGDADITYLPGSIFYEYQNLLAVLLPETLIEIPDRCFMNCSALAFVKLPSNKDQTNGAFTKIGNYAFYSCESISFITLPEGVTSIGENAFCLSSLKEINLPSTLEILEEWAFKRSNLTSIHIPDNIGIIPDDCFKGCNNLKKVTGCKGVKTIGEEAFNNCSKLSHYPYTDELESVGEYAFKDCKKFTTPLPLTVTEVGEGVIADSGITEFTIHDNLKVINRGDQPLLKTNQLTKLNVTTANDGAVKFIPNSGSSNPDPDNIDLYILKDWASRTDKLKADVASKTWNEMTWKSITLIEKDGKPVVE